MKLVYINNRLKKQHEFKYIVNILRINLIHGKRYTKYIYELTMKYDHKTQLSDDIFGTYSDQYNLVRHKVITGLMANAFTENHVDSSYFLPFPYQNSNQAIRYEMIYSCFQW